MGSLHKRKTKFVILILREEPAIIFIVVLKWLTIA